ncbi:MAG TPA: hypothetical protein VK118_01170 [Tetragenococcus sp.]|nr:hypothetical protein [Tetragenococcus sp.]
MAKKENELWNRLSAEGVKGPFITIMMNSNLTPQGTEKDQLKLKNFMKSAKKRFDKRYPDLDWTPFQLKFDQLFNDREFFRDTSTSVAIVLTAKEIYINRLSIRVDDQYYVGDTPYLLAMIKNEQFNYRYYLLALNRTSMSLYLMDNKKLTQVKLSDGAPIDMKTALGEEVTGGQVNFSHSTAAPAGVGYHSTNAKDEEDEVDWNNYYQAIGKFLKNDFVNQEGLPLYLYALPENQTTFKKNVNYAFYDPSFSISRSPAQLSRKELEKETEKITAELMQAEISDYQKLMERKNFDQIADIKQAASLGRIDKFFISTNNLQENFGDDPESEYDWRQVLNTTARDVLRNNGNVYVLEEENAPGKKTLFASLRY